MPVLGAYSEAGGLGLAAFFLLLVSQKRTGGPLTSDPSSFSKVTMRSTYFCPFSRVMRRRSLSGQAPKDHITQRLCAQERVLFGEARVVTGHERHVDHLDTLEEASDRQLVLFLPSDQNHKRM